LRPYRSRLDIVADILTSAEPGRAKLTTLLYGSSLSSGRLRHLLPLMMAAGLIAKTDEGYATTEKGRAYLKVYAELKSMFSLSAGGGALLDPALVKKASDLIDVVKKADRDQGLFTLEGRSRMTLQAAAYYILARREAMPFTLYDASRLFGVSITPIRMAKKLIDDLIPK
jgi:predicted transcriptional regulator